MSKKLVKINKNESLLSTFFLPPCANDAMWRPRLEVPGFVEQTPDMLLLTGLVNCELYLGQTTNWPQGGELNSRYCVSSMSAGGEG